MSDSSGIHHQISTVRDMSDFDPNMAASIAAENTFQASQERPAASTPTLSLHALAGVWTEVNRMDEPMDEQQHRCTAENLGLRCDLNAGHDGDHEARPGTTTTWVWTNEARELERRVEDANA